MADPQRLAEIGDAVRRRLAANPAASSPGGADIDLFTVAGFATADECRALAETIDREARPSPLFGDGGSGRTDIRTSSTHTFHRDPLALELAARMDGLLGLDRTHAEPLQGQRYRTGEHYRHHTDFFIESRDHWQRERLRGGQRTWTAMLYLNAVDGGGETDFPRIGVSVRPECGLLVVWNNMNRRGRPDRQLLHAGMPVKRGEKFVITQWYRLEAWHPAVNAS